MAIAQDAYFIPDDIATGLAQEYIEESVVW